MTLLSVWQLCKSDSQLTGLYYHSAIKTLSFVCVYIVNVRLKAYLENSKFAIWFMQVLQTSSGSQPTNGLVIVVSAHYAGRKYISIERITHFTSSFYSILQRCIWFHTDARLWWIKSESSLRLRWQEDYMHVYGVTYAARVSRGITMLAWFSSSAQWGLITHHRFPESSSSPLGFWN